MSTLLRRLSKWILPILLVGCQLEPDEAYVPEIIRDTTYVLRETRFGLATSATLYMVSFDSIGLSYWYSITKLDSTPIDSVFLTGYLHEWSIFRTSANMMDSTRVVVWPHNAASWNNTYNYSEGEFEANTRWYTADWPTGLVTYSIGLGYK